MVDKKRLRGAYLGRGYNIVTLADEMVISVPTLRARIEKNTLTLKDINMIEEILGLDVWESDDIFFGGRYKKMLEVGKNNGDGPNAGWHSDNSREPYSERLDLPADPEESGEPSARDEKDSED